MKKTKLLIIVFLMLFVSLIIISPFVNGGASKLYWYKHFDNVSDITFTELGSGSETNSSNRMEGLGSIKVGSPLNDGTEATIAASTIPYYNVSDIRQATTLGCWIYFNETSGTTSMPSKFLMWIMSNDDGTNQTQVTLENRYNGSMYTIQFGYMDSATAWYYEDIGIQTVNLANSWHWFEISIWSDGTRDSPSDKPVFTQYIDGITWSAGLIQGTGASHSVIITKLNNVIFYNTYTSVGYVLYDYLRFYQGEEYPPYMPPVSTSSSGSGINFWDIKAHLALRLGLDEFTSGLIISLFVLIMIELPFLIFASDNIFTQAIIALGTLGFSTTIGWLPPYTYIIVFIMTVLLFADVIRHKVGW